VSPLGIFTLHFLEPSREDKKVLRRLRQGICRASQPWIISFSERKAFYPFWKAICFRKAVPGATPA